MTISAERKREYNQRYYQKHKERLKADVMRYYEENKETVKEYKKKYSDENREYLRQRDKAYYRRKGKHEVRMLGAARDRAKRFGLDFNITVEDIHVPEFCPLLGIPLTIADGKRHVKFNSPRLDRIDPTKGYVKGNVWVISHRANTMKNTAVFEEFEIMYRNWKKMRELGYPQLGKASDVGP
jgi:hypothetical protein